jgi:ABC-2 type transport system permease protein
VSAPGAHTVPPVEDLKEIAAIWRGEVTRALKSGRVWVLLLLFMLFVGLALVVVGFLNHQLNTTFEQQVASAGADLDAARKGLLSSKRQFLSSFVTDDTAMLDSLATLPLVLLMVFKLTVRFVPLFIALMGFDQLAGEVGPKSVRYLVVRVKRSSIILGKFLSQATLFALLLAVCVVLMVAVARALNADFGAPEVALWTAKLMFSALVLSLAYLSLTTLCSALVKQGGISLVVNVIALFVIWFMAALGEAFRFPGQEAAAGGLDLVREASATAYLRYASVWHFGSDLLHPGLRPFLTAVLMHVGYALVFLGTAQLVLRRRDL